MRWQEIDHYYNGFNASVITVLEGGNPDFPVRFDGVIICNGARSVAYLERVGGGKFLKPAPQARVVLHNPVAPGGWGVPTVRS